LLRAAFAAPDCLVDIDALPPAGLTASLVAVGFPIDGFPLLAGVAAGVRTLDAEAAVGFERSVVIFRLGFSTGVGAGAPVLDRASDAAVGAYSPEEGVLGRISDNGVLERVVVRGVLTREGVVGTDGLGVADTRFVAALAAGPVDMVDCPVSCGFKGVELVDPPDAVDLSGVAGEGLTVGLGAGDLTDEASRVDTGLVPLGSGDLALGGSGSVETTGREGGGWASAGGFGRTTSGKDSRSFSTGSVEEDGGDGFPRTGTGGVSEVAEVCTLVGGHSRLSLISS
jgi:hypothetical protein